MVPFPVTVPRAGIVKLIFCVRTPSGATRASVLRFWMDVSDPLCDPDNAEIADILDERLKPASLVCDRRIGPTITNLSTGPVIPTLTERVPPCSFDPEGRMTPS